MSVRRYNNVMGTRLNRSDVGKIRQKRAAAVERYCRDKAKVRDDSSLKSLIDRTHESFARRSRRGRGVGNCAGDKSIESVKYGLYRFITLDEAAKVGPAVAALYPVTGYLIATAPESSHWGISVDGRQFRVRKL